MNTLKDTLQQELILFRASLETERIKRRAILTADGKRISALTQKTEILLQEIEALEMEREKIAVGLLKSKRPNHRGETPSLTELIRLACDSDPEELETLGALASEYRETVQQLKLEVEENESILRHTSARIHQLLTDVAATASVTMDGTYSPAEKSREKRVETRSLFVSANA